MQTKLHGYADRLSMEQASDTPPDGSLVSLLGRTAEAVCPAKDNFICSVATSLITQSYRSNPSLFSSRVRAHTTNFPDCSGRMSQDGNTVIVALYRIRRDRSLPFQDRHRLSIKAKVIQAIQDGLILTVPIAEIPPFFQTHSEQLTYQVFKETRNRIQITKQKTQWKIQLK